MKIEDLVAASYNPRTITAEALGGLKISVRELGDISGIVWNKRSGQLVCGHQRIKALKEEFGDALQMDNGFILTPKGDQFSIRVVDWDEAKERLANVMANNRHIMGDFTKDAIGLVQGLNVDFPDLSEGMQLSELLSDLQLEFPEKKTGKKDPDDAPPVQKKAITQDGDIWILDKHRVGCGDSKSKDDMSRLMKAEKATMMFTDPPWNVGIGQDSNPRHRQREGLKNDSLSAEEFEAFLDGAISLWPDFVKGDVYCVLGASEWPRLDLVLRAHGFHWSATVIWVKDVFVLGRSKYHRRYEPIWYGWHKDGRSSFGGDRKQDDVWEIARPKKSPEHPTMKPVDLVLRAIGNSSRPDDLILDPFLGSGTTLIAAEQSGRRCCGMDIDPLYVDVAVKRWAEFTGQDPVRESDGAKWSDLAANHAEDPAAVSLESER